MKIHQLLLMATAICILGLSSCQDQIDYSDLISKVENMDARVDSARQAQKDLKLQEVQKGINVIKKDLKYAQDSVKIKVSLEDGVLFDKYKDLTKLFKKYPVEKVEKEYLTTKTQLQNFKSVLEAKATKDKNGNKIDKDYLRNNFNLEMKAANNYIYMITELEERSMKFRKGFKEQKPVIDSLIKEITIIK